MEPESLGVLVQVGTSTMTRSWLGHSINYVLNYSRRGILYLSLKSTLFPCGIKSLLSSWPLRKRVSQDPSNSPVYLEVWGQLLLHVQNKHPKFASQLLDRVIGDLTSSEEEDPSLHACLSGWVIWLVKNWGNRGVDCTHEDALSLLLFEIGKGDSSEMTR